MRLTRIVLVVAAVSIVAIVALAIASFTLRMFWVPMGAIVGGIMATLLLGVCAGSCAAMIERGRLPVLMWGGLVAAGVALASWLSLVFFDAWLSWPAGDTVARLSVIPSGAAVWCGLIGVLWRQRRVGAAARWTRRVAIAGVSGFIVAVLVAILFEDAFGYRYERELIKLIGVTGLIGGAATLGAIILIRARQLWEGAPGTDADTADGPRLDFEAVCPRCDLRQAMVTGGGSCSRCGLQIKVSVP